MSRCLRCWSRLRCAPPQVLIGAGALATSRLAGSVCVSEVCVNAKSLLFEKVMVKVAGEFASTLAGATFCATVGAAALKVNGTGQAVAALPALAVAVVLAAEAVKFTVAVSKLPAESVTFTDKVPAPLHFTMACAVVPPETISTEPVVLQA